MPMLYRIWTKVRKCSIQEWDTLHQGPWDAAVQGSSALRAAVLSCFQDELNQLGSKEIGAILWDMEKFYDNIHIPKLIARAQELGYPIDALALGLHMHMAPRAIRAYGHYAVVPHFSNGIIAGCTQSTFWARLFLYAILRKHANAPGIHIRSFLDDISQRAVSDSKEGLTVALTNAGTALANDLVASGCLISQKTTVLAKTLDTRLAIVRGMGMRHVYVSSGTYAKDLGVGTNLGGKRITRFVAQRILKAKGRVKRIAI